MWFSRTSPATICFIVGKGKSHAASGQNGSEEVIRSAVPGVGSARVIAVQLLESERECFLLGTQDHVMVVRHEAPRVDLPLEESGDSTELRDELIAVPLVEDDRPPIGATTDHVVRVLRIDGTEGAAHAGTVSAHAEPVKARADSPTRFEREGFLKLCGEAKTLERMSYTLKTGKTLRN